MFMYVRLYIILSKSVFENEPKKRDNFQINGRDSWKPHSHVGTQLLPKLGPFVSQSGIRNGDGMRQNRKRDDKF